MRARASSMAVLAAAIAQTACATHALGPVGSADSRRATWRYEVRAEDGAGLLAVDAWLPRGSLADLVVRPEAAPFLRDPQLEEGGSWRDLRRTGSGVHAPECAQGCHVRYQFALRAAADALGDTDSANAWGDVLEAAPSMWLLHPTLAAAGTRYRFHVAAAPGLSFVTGVFAAADGARDAYEADATDLAIAPYAAFGPLTIERVVPAAGAAVDVAIAPGEYQQSPQALAEWVRSSARTMARFFGCFPIERVLVLVVPASGDEVRRGNTMGDGGAAIVVEVGRSADAAELSSDWVLPHEMAHLAVPSVSRRFHWIEEGIAVYLQPIARARAGQIRPEAVWTEFVNGMPLAAAGADREGLDGTVDWASTYWGGATFCLVADVEIRKRTGNRFGFEDALRGVLASGGSVARTWSLDRLVDTADAWVGTPVLRATHGAMGARATTANLAGLFRDLGVRVEDGKVTFVEDAPLAALRRAITAPLPDDTADDAPIVCPNAAAAWVAAR